MTCNLRFAHQVHLSKFHRIFAKKVTHLLTLPESSILTIALNLVAVNSTRFPNMVFMLRILVVSIVRAFHPQRAAGKKPIWFRTFRRRGELSLLEKTTRMPFPGENSVLNTWIREGGDDVGSSQVDVNEWKMDASVAFATSFHTIQKLLLTASEVDSSVRKILRSTAFESASHTRPTRLLQKMPRFALNSWIATFAREIKTWRFVGSGTYCLSIRMPSRTVLSQWEKEKLMIVMQSDYLMWLLALRSE